MYAEPGMELNRSLQPLGHAGSCYRAVKRLQDLILALTALIVLSPLMAFIALIIWLDSPGASPIFTQTRIGRNGKPFRFYKFRTMVPDAEQQLEALLPRNEMSGPAFKLRDDPRITRAGRFLRRSCLDELPQLINVIRGDMSIVGPRPPLPREVDQYTPRQMQRLSVTPGLTCLWQVSPNRNKLDFEQWLALDFSYIRRRSLLLDWSIILRTVGVVFSMGSL